MLFQVVLPTGQKFAERVTGDEDRAIGLRLKLIGTEVSFVADFQDPAIDPGDSEGFNHVTGQ